jgi:hypothetical protein
MLHIPPYQQQYQKQWKNQLKAVSYKLPQSYLHF